MNLVEAIVTGFAAIGAMSIGAVAGLLLLGIRDWMDDIHEGL
jgi:hypothetical protein